MYDDEGNANGTQVKPVAFHQRKLRYRKTIKIEIEQLNKSNFDDICNNGFNVLFISYLLNPHISAACRGINYKLQTFHPNILMAMSSAVIIIGISHCIFRWLI